MDPYTVTQYYQIVCNLLSYGFKLYIIIYKHRSIIARHCNFLVPPEVKLIFQFNESRMTHIYYLTWTNIYWYFSKQSITQFSNNIK